MNAQGNGESGTVDVHILGETYSLKSETSPEYTRRVADHGDKMAREIRKESGVVDQKKLAILAAITITDQLFRMRDGVDRVKAVAENRAERLKSEVVRFLEGGSDA